jgi:coproporphyrinogen III oxidase
MGLPHRTILLKDEAMNHSLSLAEKQAIAESWFRMLRDSICQSFETLEAEAFAHDKTRRCCGSCNKTGEEKCASSPAHFTRTPWQRDDQMSGMNAGSGGEISLMKGPGRVF